MSASALAMTSAVPTAYDFSTAQSQAFGVNPMNLMGSKYVLVPGDENELGDVSAMDWSAVLSLLIMQAILRGI